MDQIAHERDGAGAQAWQVDMLDVTNGMAVDTPVQWHVMPPLQAVP